MRGEVARKRGRWEEGGGWEINREDGERGGDIRFSTDDPGMELVKHMALIHAYGGGCTV